MGEGVKRLELILCLHNLIGGQKQEEQKKSQYNVIIIVSYVF